MAAMVVAAYRKDDFNFAEWIKYKDLVSEDDLEIIKRLAVILRIAESFDRSVSQTIVGINCDVLGDSVIMKTEVESDVSLEIKDALCASLEFKKAFSKNLEIL
jgi:exopolyphosphatase/guanosine-5'-triphosphate,3'-diphosphate pyrophosphatase